MVKRFLVTKLYGKLKKLRTSYTTSIGKNVNNINRPVVL